MWRDLKENAMTVSKSVDDFNERKPRTRISLSKDVLAEFEKIRRGYGKNINNTVLIFKRCVLYNVPNLKKGFVYDLSFSTTRRYILKLFNIAKIHWRKNSYSQI